MRCSVCGRAAVRPIQLCPGCSAAIERAEDQARKLDPLIGLDSRTAASAWFEMPSLFSAARTSRRGIFSRPSHRGAFVAAWLCTMVVFALPANVEQLRDGPIPENAISPITAMAPSAQTRVGNRTQVNIADVPEERSPTARPATSVSPASSKASAQSASSRAPERPRAKVAQLSSTRHLSVAKSARLGAVQAHRTPIPPVNPAPPVQAAAQSVAEAPISTQPKRQVAPRDIAVTTLNEALQQCGEQSVLVRSWCEHRARTRYCDAEGWTGPECPVAVSKEHGT